MYLTLTVKNKTKNTLWPYTNVKIIYLGNLIFLYQSKRKVLNNDFPLGHFVLHVNT